MIAVFVVVESPCARHQLQRDFAPCVACVVDQAKASYFFKLNAKGVEVIGSCTETGSHHHEGFEKEDLQDRML